MKVAEARSTNFLFSKIELRWGTPNLRVTNYYYFFAMDSIVYQIVWNPQLLLLDGMNYLGITLIFCLQFCLTGESKKINKWTSYNNRFTFYLAKQCIIKKTDGSCKLSRKPK